MRLDIVPSLFVDAIMSSHHDRRRSVPVSARCNRSPSLTMPITLLSVSTTGTALMPRSASSLATAGTVASSSTEITSLVMTSIACIGSPQTVWVSNRIPHCSPPAQAPRPCNSLYARVKAVTRRPSRLANASTAAAHLHGQFVLAFTQVDNMSEQDIRRPLDVADLDDHIGPHPMDPAKHQR